MAVNKNQDYLPTSYSYLGTTQYEQFPLGRVRKRRGLGRC